MTNLPMLGLTHGNRSAVTCHLKCDSQCARPDPNSSHRADLRRHRRSPAHPPGRAGRRRSAGRRSGPAGHLARAGGRRPEPGDDGPLAFTAIDSVAADVDTLTVPTGLPVDVDPPLGRPVVRRLARRSTRRPDAEAQELQFGYNNDYLDILVDRRGRTGAAVLQPRVHEPGDHVPADHRAERGGRGAAHADGCARLQRRRARAARPQAAVALPSGAAAATVGSRPAPRSG